MAADTPVIPQTITVHLGRPNAAARNVTVPFTDYLKNVASSEIYPTWPENAIRANIYAQASFALNRIYTEHYRSRGYDFDITNSTAYDQAYVDGRSVFSNVAKIVDELFNNYVTKGDQVQPYFTQYCSGREVTCDGLSQWGTVTLANQGYTPYRILQYYYGNGAMIRVPEYDPDAFLCMVTRKGIIKRTSLDAYRNVRKNGVIAINLDDDDELAWVRLTSGNDDLLIATRKGMGIRFNENDARPLGRTARGVKAIELREGDEVVGMEVLDDAKAVLTVSTTGYGRRSEPSDYRLQSRGGKGTINYRTETYGDVAAIAVVDESEDVIFISSDGIIIRIPVSQISTFARPSKGVRVMRVSEGEQLVTVACTPSEEDQEKPEETAAEEVSPAEDSENSETEE